ncbi:MAG: Asp-tRNA(Asn)/Glu-tRNA(Gln) amidotransferase GatCAB subunit B, partial [Planctomycetota bacterium]
KVLKERGETPEKFPVRPKALAALLALAAQEGLEVALARRVFEEMLATGADAAHAKAKIGIAGAGDEGAIRAIAEQAIAAAPKAVADFKSGKTSAIQAIVGQAMKIAKGKVSPQKAREAIEGLLK